MSNSLVQTANELIRANPSKVQQVRKNPALAGWFVGQIMKDTNATYSVYEVRKVLARRGIGEAV